MTEGEGDARRRLAFDSNAVTYFLRTNAGEAPGPDALSPDRIACLRLFLTHDVWIMPTVAQECAVISDELKREMHRLFIQGNFAEFLPDKQEQAQIEAILERCASRLGHRLRNDCRIIAEATYAKLDAVVTSDTKMRRRHDEVTVPIISPFEAWERFKGPPQWTFGAGHPLHGVPWATW